MPKEEESLEIKFDKFVEQYEQDMRGDKNLDNGNLGVIGNIRKVKDTQQKHAEDHKKYPSLTYLILTKPFQTISAILIVYFLLDTLATLGMLKIFASLFGVPFP